MTLFFSPGSLPLAEATSSGYSLLLTEVWQRIASDQSALLWFTLFQLALVLILWGAARTFVPRRELNSFGQFEKREGGGLLQSVALYLAYAGLVVFALFLFSFIPVAFQLHIMGVLAHPLQQAAMWSIAFGAFLLIVLIVTVVLPMAIFRIGSGRALMMLCTVFVVSGSVGWILNRSLGGPVDRQLAVWQERGGDRAGGVLSSFAGQAQEEVAFAAAERDARDKAKPIGDRKAAVRSLYTQLEQMRTRLQQDDIQARAEFNRKNARYEEQLRALRQEIAASTAPR